MAVAVAKPLSMSTRRSPPAPMDFSDLPELTDPVEPTNTLIITNLNNPVIFHPQSLETVKQLLVEHSPEPLLAFAPLKSFRRIIVAFHSDDAALAVYKMLDGEGIMNCRIRVYFGEPTPLEPKDQHLQAPKSDKLFFISPPPSPPAGWEMRNEEPPNKDVHAEDLASALAKLSARRSGPDDWDAGTTTEAEAEAESERQQQRDTVRRASQRHSLRGRPRSESTTIVYHPEDHGDSPDLPAISVEDTTASPGQLTPMEDVRRPFEHTARPPVELMDR